MKRLAILVVAVAFLMPLSACFGPMNLTRGFDDWTNQNYVDSPWLSQLMLYTGLIPIAYTVTYVLDFFLLNVLDFWGESAFRGTGTKYIHKNPVAPEPR